MATVIFENVISNRERARLRRIEAYARHTKGISRWTIDPEKMTDEEDATTERWREFMQDKGIGR